MYSYRQCLLVELWCGIHIVFISMLQTKYHMDKIKAHLILIIGPVGAKMDFVSGWLGKTPEFIDSEWSIDLVTGRSSGIPYNFKILDNGSSIKMIEDKIGVEIVESKDVKIAGSCHGLNLHNFIDEVNAGKITPLVIDVDLCDCEVARKIYWNYIIKTFMTKERSRWARRSSVSNLNVDRLIGDIDVTDAKIISAIESKIMDIPIANELPKEFLSVDYNKLFKTGGSIYLCETLGLDVDSIYHKFWDKMLEFSYAPNSIFAYGQNWNKNDYF